MHSSLTSWRIKIVGDKKNEIRECVNILAFIQRDSMSFCSIPMALQVIAVM